MKKYLFIYKSELMSNLHYVFNLLAGFVSSFLMLFIFFNLWTYIYTDPNELINGYNMNQMIWYVIIAEIIYMSLSGRSVCRNISNDVRSGNIAYNINKPYDYILYSLSNHLGRITVRGIIYLVLGFATGLIFMGSMPSHSILSFIAVIFSMILAMVISMLFLIAIGLLAFFIEDSNPYYWLYSKFVLVLGTIFPIEYFPHAVQSILKYSPIVAMNYGPAKLFVDFSWSNFGLIIISQIIYLTIAFIICKLIYKKGVKRLNVNGG